jgi:hypothetical protein
VIELIQKSACQSSCSAERANLEALPRRRNALNGLRAAAGWTLEALPELGQLRHGFQTIGSQSLVLSAP